MTETTENQKVLANDESVPDKYRGRTPHLIATLDKEELKDRFAVVTFDNKDYYVDEPSLNQFVSIQALMEEMEGEEMSEEQAMEGIESLQTMLLEIAPGFKDCKLNFRRIQEVIKTFAELVQMPEDEVLEELGVKTRTTGEGDSKKEDSPSSDQ